MTTFVKRGAETIAALSASRPLRRGAAAVAAVVGFAAAAWALTPTWAFTYDPARERFADNAQPRLVLTVGEAVKDQLIVAETIEVDGRVVVPSGVVIIANELIFRDGAAIASPSGDVKVAAVRVRGGVISASATPSKDAGAAGRHGGRITLVAARVDGLRLVSNGGDGVAGEVGEPGRTGRRGRCGAGEYRGARAGGQGGAGGRGGDAGHAGRIDVIYAGAAGLDVVGDARAGAPGVGGPGGPGGRGGAGCVGLGGSQPTRANGPAGPHGSIEAAAPDAPPMSTRAAVRFSDVAADIRRIVSADVDTGTRLEWLRLAFADALSGRPR